MSEEKRYTNKQDKLKDLQPNPDLVLTGPKLSFPCPSQNYYFFLLFLLAYGEKESIFGA